jgi:hypothetical protein
MNKSFFFIICGFLMYTATMTVQAQSEDYEHYYREFQVELSNGKYGLLFRGEVVVPYEYDAIVAQRDNRGFISKQGSKFGIIGIGTVYYVKTPKSDGISRQGWKFLIEKGVGGKDIDLYMIASVVPCEFDKIEYVDDKFWVRKREKIGIYNVSGSNVLGCEFDEINVKDGKYWVRKGKQTGIYNMSGSNVLNCDNYDYIKVVDGKYNVGKGGFHGIYNMSGSNVLHCEFDEIKIIDGKYWVSKGKMKGIYNSSGSTILRCEFDKIELTSDGKYIAYKKGEKSLYSSTGSRLQTDFDVIYSTD